MSYAHSISARAALAPRYRCRSRRLSGSSDSTTRPPSWADWSRKRKDRVVEQQVEKQVEKRVNSVASDPGRATDVRRRHTGAHERPRLANHSRVSPPAARCSTARTVRRAARRSSLAATRQRARARTFRSRIPRRSTRTPKSATRACAAATTPARVPRKAPAGERPADEGAAGEGDVRPGLPRKDDGRRPRRWPSRSRRVTPPRSVA